MPQEYALAVAPFDVTEDLKGSTVVVRTKIGEIGKALCDFKLSMALSMDAVLLITAVESCALYQFERRCSIYKPRKCHLLGAILRNWARHG